MAYNTKETFEDVVRDMKKWSEEDFERYSGRDALLQMQCDNFIKRLKDAVGRERVDSMYKGLAQKNERTTTTHTVVVKYGAPVVVDNRSTLEKIADGIESIFE